MTECGRRDGRLSVLVRRDGGYVQQTDSVALPNFPIDELASVLAAYPDIDEDRAVEDFRQRILRVGENQRLTCRCRPR